MTPTGPGGAPVEKLLDGPPGSGAPAPVPDGGANARLAELVDRLAVVHGRVTLSSGREADYYVDLRRATLHHEAGPLIGMLLRQLTADWDFEAVGGLTLGADPVATAMMHAPGRPLNAFVVRKEAKAHGMQRQIEGPDVAGRRVLVVEDTTTTGASPLRPSRRCARSGAEVVGVATIVDRATGADRGAGRRGPDLPLPARPGRPRPATDATVTLGPRRPDPARSDRVADRRRAGRASGRIRSPGRTTRAYDPELLAGGDRRNVVDRYRYWRREAIVADLDTPAASRCTSRSRTSATT